MQHISKISTTVQAHHDRQIGGPSDQWSQLRFDPDGMYATFLSIAEGLVARDPYATRDRYMVHDEKLIRRFISDFNTNRYRSCIVLSGPLGTGKTTMMRVMSKMLAYHKDLRYKTVLSARLVSKARSYGPRYLNDYMSGWLCINEFGKDDAPIKDFGNAIDVIDRLVYQRYESHGLPTFFTTNKNKEEFKERFDQRTWDRIEGILSWHYVVGPNYRKPQVEHDGN